MKKNKLFWILTVICMLNFAAHRSSTLRNRTVLPARTAI